MAAFCPSWIWNISLAAVASDSAVWRANCWSSIFCRIGSESSTTSVSPFLTGAPSFTICTIVLPPSTMHGTSMLLTACNSPSLSTLICISALARA